MPVNYKSAFSGQPPPGSMPLIDTPFKRVVVDIIGPIAPPSEAEHWYILTLVDYTTRYPEAVPLKKITIDIYSRVGIPEEVLRNQGTQFMSEFMQELSRLLNIKGLTSMHIILSVMDWLRDRTEP